MQDVKENLKPYIDFPKNELAMINMITQGFLNGAEKMIQTSKSNVKDPVLRHYLLVDKINNLFDFFGGLVDVIPTVDENQKKKLNFSMPYEKMSVALENI